MNKAILIDIFYYSSVAISFLLLIYKMKMNEYDIASFKKANKKLDTDICMLENERIRPLESFADSIERNKSKNNLRLTVLEHKVDRLLKEKQVKSIKKIIKE